MANIETEQQSSRKEEFEVIRDFKGRDILSARQFDRENLVVFFKKVEEMKEVLKERKTGEPLKGYILASLYFEASVQTRTALKVAMMRLGGIEIEIPMSFSLVKGLEEEKLGGVSLEKKLEDNIKMVANNPLDLIALRYPLSGTAKFAADFSPVPIINAGDGINENPGQGLAALYTIREHQEIDGSTITFCGNLKYDRTGHSLALLLSQYKDVKINLVASAEYLRMPKALVEKLKENGVKITEVSSFEDFEELNEEYGVIYLNRVESDRIKQQEIPALAAHLIDLNLVYPLTPEIVSKTQLVLSPIPRNEDLKSLPYIARYCPITDGVAVRMALLSLILKGN